MTLPEIELTPLKIIHHPKGNIFHALKASDSSYFCFGEVYFTSINYGEIKGWKKHTKMTMNIVVPVGSVRFHLYDEWADKTSYFDIGSTNYKRLTIPPGYWVAFSNITSEENLILNIANMEHNPLESENVEINKFPLANS